MQQMPVLQSSVAPVEGRLNRSLVPSLPAIRPDRLKTAKALVDKAVKLRRVFSVQGPYPVIRTALWARGWVERCLPHPVQRPPHYHGDEDDDGDDGDVCADVTERGDEGEKEENFDDMYELMSRLVRNETPYFHWTTRRDYIDCRGLRSDQVTNHYANVGTFTTKVGLCVNLRNLQWFDAADPDTFFPRCYRLGAEDEKHAFIEDFRRTACTSLLQHVVETWSRQGAEVGEQKAKTSTVEELDPEMIDTALHVCEEFLSVLEHGDIDVTAETAPTVEGQQWTEFLQNYYMVVHEGAVISGSGVFVGRCQAMLNRLQECCPQLDTDGLSNIWIIKPGAKSRGRGIMCMNRLEDILALIDTDRAMTKESKWVVQKYLERPLLVHGTKFDLRQWFLVTDWNPLTVWFYKECYLRFSTQPYSTKNLDSSVHLCNNSIQKHFQPSRDRHPAVPLDNMWSCSQFKAFLQQQGRGAKWETVVVPGMQQAVVHALQTAQDLVEHRKASFELYGADFMLGRDLRPWLLEINASPTMACSTAVTARLCPAVQLDTLRVVLDWRADSSAYTGGFHIIYKQTAVEVPHYVGMNLLVEGASVRRSRPLLRAFPAIQFSSDRTSPIEVKTRHKSSHQKTHAVAVSNHAGKENQTAEDTKGQLTSTSPKKMQRKEQRLRLSANRATLVPRSLSFSLSSPHSMLHCKSQAGRGQASHITRFFLPQTISEAQHKTSTQVFPSLQGPLPTLEILSLKPVTGNSSCRNLTLSSRRSFHRHHSFLCSNRQNMAKHKEDYSGEHTVCSEDRKQTVGR
ncbi:tubulin monoglycylase TTLL3 [Solea solea]|uniref:tubulin monoglycylase TTLL3 n=1 Tax=Solea solea TaxID=90069 RepID=UPI002729C981|nr:tubulin monoglycylase TTLL3 [Solea solea]